MYAIIETGGKQYKVSEGQTLKVESLPTKEGEAIDFNTVLMVANGEKIKIGTPTVDGCKVTARVVEHGRHKKIKIIKFKRRKHHMKQMGHRQNYTAVQIEKIAE